MAKARRFGFRTFVYDRKYKRKREAKLRAEYLKSLGYNYRIVKVKDGWVVWKRW
ncbi:hypothetical protein J7M02_02650 [Candidatus Aerophobetes bacterium]|nr:hypothetical protein [Candidatus Aerophobetes bacterium]